MTLEVMTKVNMFLIFFPRKFLETVIAKLTRNKLSSPLTFAEFLRYIGIWLLIVRSSPGNMNRKEFWSKKAISRKRGAPYRFNDLMTGSRFEDITNALEYTDKAAPTYKDRFWEVRQMIEEWNNNMKDMFIPAWITCLDESMSIWTNRWTCPGWVFCLRKPHPFGNEYHTIACGLSGILFRMEMVEGKDRPSELPKDPKAKSTSNLLL